MRQQRFSAVQYEALFAQSERVDHSTQARPGTERKAQPSDEQNRDALDVAVQELTDSQRVQRPAVKKEELYRSNSRCASHQLARTATSSDPPVNIPTR